MKLALIYTGGTIGGRIGADGTIARAHTAADFEKRMKERLPEDASGVSVQGVFGKLSENMGPPDWLRLARAVDRQIRNGASGVVVAHGTDTLVYSACALHELLEGVPVPVVVTGAGLPLEAPGTDAVRNLSHALAVARAKRPGVWICFAGGPASSSLVLEPRNAVKTAGRSPLFQPVWGAPAGTVSARSGHVTWNGPVGQHPRPYRPRFRLAAPPVLFTVHPGFDPDWIRLAVRRKYGGIVLAGYGSGTACAAGSFDLRPAVREAVRRGVAVWMVSQHGGWVAPAYGSTAALERAGVRLRPGLTPEAAFTELMCAAPEDRARLDGRRAEGYRRGEQRRIRA